MGNQRACRSTRYFDSSAIRFRQEQLSHFEVLNSIIGNVQSNMFKKLEGKTRIDQINEAKFDFDIYFSVCI